MFYFSKTLPNCLIYKDQNDRLWAIPMVGSNQYGWDRRTSVYLHPANLIALKNYKISLIAGSQGVPKEIINAALNA